MYDHGRAVSTVGTPVGLSPSGGLAVDRRRGRRADGPPLPHRSRRRGL